MNKFLITLNTILISIVIGFIVLMTIGFLLGDRSDYGIWVFVLVFSGLILFLLFFWKGKLNKSKTLNPKNPSTIQKEVTQKDTPKPSVKEEEIEPKESDESISQSPKTSEPPMEESISEDKEKVLSDFIELCLLGGELTDKKKEVVFRKSNELGIPDDECEIMIDSILFKMKNQ